MENNYRYFNRDISWLSFNHRVLMESADASVALYDRINFMAIYSSNLEEYYKVRVAEHKAVARGGYSEELTQDEARVLIGQIADEVNKQLEDRIRIFQDSILPELKWNRIVFYQHRQEVEEVHHEFIANYFREEIFPYLQPVPVSRTRVKVFLRADRLYLCTRLRRKDNGVTEYYIMKLPYSKVPRFVELPQTDGYYYIMYMEDIIKAMEHEPALPEIDVKEAYETIEAGVVGGYKKIENTVVSGYKKVEHGAVNGFRKLSDFFIRKLFSREGETVEETRKRLSRK